MPRTAAGLVMYRVREGVPEVLLAHPGGPLWARKDAGVWTIPKGEPDAGEGLLAAAIREFNEETGLAPHGPYTPLGSIQQRGGKIVHAWAFAGDYDAASVRSNTFELEWPPRSGNVRRFPEIDRAAFCNRAEAERLIKPAQWPLIDRLYQVLRG